MLAQAMSELAIAQPADSIAFVSQWMNTYVEGVRAKEQQDAETAQLASDRAAYQAQVKKQEAAKAAKAATEQEKKDGVTGITSSLNEKLASPEDKAANFSLTWEPPAVPQVIAGDPVGTFDEIYQELADKAQVLTGARGVYVAKVETGDAGETLHYTHVSGNTSDIPTNVDGTLLYDHKFVLDLAFPKPSGEESDGSKFVVWDAFTKTEPDPDDENAPPPRYPTTFIKDVMDDERVQFYGVTRLGSLLVIPIVYDNCLSEPNLEQAKEFLATKSQTLVDAKEAYDKFVADAAAAAEAEPDPDAEKPEPVPTVEEVAKATVPEPLPVSESVRAALCIDTLGTEGQITPEQIAMLEEAAKAIVSYRSRFDTYAVWQQAAVARNGVEEVTAAKAAYEARAGEVAAAIEAAQGAVDPADKKNDELEVEKLQLEYNHYKELLVEKEAEVLAYKDLAVVNAAATPAWAAAALFANMEPTTVLAQGTGTPVWEKIKLKIPEILEAVKNTTPTGPRTGLKPRNKLEFYKPLSDKASASIGDLQQSPELQPLLHFVTTAIKLRDADCKVRSAIEGAEPDDDMEFAPPPPES
jgi:hypothetical protein